MPNSKVVITGLGAVAPTGLNVPEIWKSALDGKSGIGEISAFDASNYTTRIAGEIDFDPENYFVKRDARKMDRFTQFAVVASLEALKNAGLEINDQNSERIGVIIGSGIGGITTLEQQLRVLDAVGPRKISPYVVPMMISNLAAGQVSIVIGAKGTSYCPVSACASGSHAIGEAVQAIKRGIVDVVVCGGSEAPITSLSVGGFCAIRALSTRNSEPQRASRPFDKDRDGFVIAEGSGVVVIESEEFARKRGANVYCEIAGYGTTADAFHIVQPDTSGSGASRAMGMAIEDSGSAPTDIDYINAHGTSTPYNDMLETLAIKKVLGDHARNILISSTKSMTGHLLGAAGGLEAVYCALTIRDGIAPPTINLESPDPECDLNYVPNKPVKKKINCAISNSFGFGGQNASLLFRRLA